MHVAFPVIHNHYLNQTWQCCPRNHCILFEGCIRSTWALLQGPHFPSNVFFVQHFPITVCKTNSGAWVSTFGFSVFFFLYKYQFQPFFIYAFVWKEVGYQSFMFWKVWWVLFAWTLLHDGDFGDGVGREIQNCRVNQYQASNVGRIPFQRVELNVCALCFWSLTVLIPFQAQLLS